MTLQTLTNFIAEQEANLLDWSTQREIDGAQSYCRGAIDLAWYGEDITNKQKLELEQRVARFPEVYEEMKEDEERQFHRPGCKFRAPGHPECRCA